jgi:hypothetical protein
MVEKWKSVNVGIWLGGYRWEGEKERKKKGGKMVKVGKVWRRRWKDGRWKVERLKSWKRGEQGERMSWEKGIKQEKGMKGSNQIREEWAEVWS